MDLKPVSASSGSGFSSVGCQIHMKILKSASLSPLEWSLISLLHRLQGTKPGKRRALPYPLPSSNDPLPRHYLDDYILGHLNYQGQSPHLKARHQIMIASARPFTTSLVT